jgi:hypothetical protein
MATILAIFGPDGTFGRLVIDASGAIAAWIRSRLAWAIIASNFGRLLAWGLLRCGFAAAFVAILICLLLSDPGQDYMLGFALDASSQPWKGALLWGGVVMWVTVWVFITWFWSYIALYSAEAAPGAGQLAPHTQDRFLAWLKHWLATVIAGLGGIGVAACFAWIYWCAPTDNVDYPTPPSLAIAAAAVVITTVGVLAWTSFYAGYMRRQWQQSSDPAGATILWRWIILPIEAAMLVFFLVRAIQNPVTLSQDVGGAFNLAVVAAMAWVGNGTTLVLLGDAWRIPLVGMAVVWFALVSTISNQHQLDTATIHAPRRTLQSALTAWKARPTAGNHPLVLVATAGGGMRAAYWTATVLGAARDKVPGFDTALFAISGVSGGSVGAAIYAAASSHGLAGCKPQASIATPTYELCAQQALSEDLLGPTLVGYAFTDLFQGFVPTFIHRFKDRASALELAMAQGWSNAFGNDANPLNASMDGLYRGPHADTVPELLLNGTSVRTGTRVITASLETPGSVFPAAIDARAAFGIDPPLAEAAMNSARFPYVTPVAAVGVGADADEIGDGGYFENFGAATIQDVLHWLRNDGKYAGPIVIMSISSDDTLPPDAPFKPASAGACEPHAAHAPPALEKLLPQAMAPGMALSNGRSAHGILASWRLLQAATEAGATFIPFRLTRPTGQHGVPLSWYLSSHGRATLAGQINSCANTHAVQELRAAMNPSPPLQAQR